MILRRYCWELLGFGLPVYAASKLLHPLLLVGSLQLLQAASAELVVADSELLRGADSEGGDHPMLSAADSNKGDRNCSSDPELMFRAVAKFSFGEGEWR